MRGMQGVILHDYDLRVGWGKSVPLPAQPLYDGKVRRWPQGGGGEVWLGRSVVACAAPALRSAAGARGRR